VSAQSKIVHQFAQAFCLAVALMLFGGAAVALAQNAENGRRLAERWCVECHAIEAGKPGKAVSFATIAAKDGVTSEMIASFLRLPHATMPNLPLTRTDPQDIAAFIMGMKK
jgi:mono/diheme cytochrome c family protein